MGTKRILIAFLGITLSASAFAKKPPPPPQFIVVRKLPPEAVVQRFQLNCAQHGMSIVSVTATQVECTQPMNDSLKSLFIRALTQPAYATNPIYHYRVNAIRVGDSTTVSVEEFAQYQNAYGQTTTIPITNRNELTSIGTGLQQMKAKWESRLAAAGDDERAALAAADADLAAQGGVIANQPVAAPPASSSAPAITNAGQPQSSMARADLHPSAAAAKQTLAQFQCAEAVRLVGESGGKAIFEGSCSHSRTRLVQCAGMTCKPLD